MKKIVAFIMFLCLCAGFLAGCGGEKKNSAGSNEIKELKIAVSPYQDAETVKTAVGPLSAMLQGKLKEKGFDKWQDLAASVYDVIDYALSMRDGVTVIFTAHTQTDHDDNGFMFTRIKTSGRKLDKIVLESKFPVVLHAKVIDGKHVFETQADFSTAKTPLGAFEDKYIDNDIVEVLKVLEEY